LPSTASAPGCCDESVDETVTGWFKATLTKVGVGVGVGVGPPVGVGVGVVDGVGVGVGLGEARDPSLKTDSSQSE